MKGHVGFNGAVAVQRRKGTWEVRLDFVDLQGGMREVLYAGEWGVRWFEIWRPPAEGRTLEIACFQGAGPFRERWPGICRHLTARDGDG